MAQVIFICQAVDETDPILAGTIDWLTEFANQPSVKQLTVLTLRKGSFVLPANVEVCLIKGRNRLATIFNFYREIGRRLVETDYFFIYMGGHYPLLLWPVRLFWKRPVYQWKAHPYISPLMRFYAYCCVTKIFTSTPSAFPLPLAKVKVVGQGIDTAKFKPLNLSQSGDWLIVGRVAPVKQLEKALRLLAFYNQRYGAQHRLAIYGPVAPSEIDYKAELDELVRKLDLAGLVEFRGAVFHQAMPAVLNQHRLFLSFNSGALDRAVMEALACGLPVITPNQCVAEVLPPELKKLFIVADDDLAEQAKVVNRLLFLIGEETASLKEKVRTVAKDNSITSLINKIVREINNRYAKRVVVFHDVANQKKFERGIKWLKDNYDLVSLDNLFSQPASQREQLAVTFDDGYNCWFDKAATVLEKHQVPAAFFICSGFVGLRGQAAENFGKSHLRRWRSLQPVTVGQLKSLAGNHLFEIGSHTVHHWDLGKEADSAILEKEIGADKNQLEAWAGKPVRWFAYPFGEPANISAAAVAGVKQAGFLKAFTFVPGPVEVNGDRFLIKRTGLELAEPLWLWRLRLAGFLDGYAVNLREKLEAKRKIKSVRSILFLGKTRYSQPLDPTTDKKFHRLYSLGEIFVSGYSPSWLPVFFKQPARFYLWPRLPFVPLRALFMFIVNFLLVLFLALASKRLVVITEDPYDGFPAAAVKKLVRFFGKRVKVVVESHGDFAEAIFLQKSFFLEKSYRRLMRRLAGYALKNADALRSVSQATTNQLRAMISNKPIVQFPAWTDIELFLEAGQAKKGNSQQILFAGAVTPLKGVHHLIKAFSLLANDFPKAVLVIAGELADKNYFSSLQSLVGDLQLRERVKFLGKLTQQSLALEMRQSALFVLPSVSEGLGRVVFEAMAAGLPVVGSRVGGIPELIENGQTGWLVEAGNENNLAEKLSWLLESPAKAQLMGKEGRRFARDFFSAEAYLRNYEQLL